MSPIDTTRRILNTTERANLRRKIEMSKLDAAGEIPEADRRMKQNIHFLKDKKSNIDQRALYDTRASRIALDKGDVEELSPTEKDSLEREKKKLAEWLTGKMVPAKMFYANKTNSNGSLNPVYRKAVNAILKTELSREFTEKAHQWQNICRMLEPDNPEVGNLEELRPE
jgi:hypothetical protein